MRRAPGKGPVLVMRVVSVFFVCVFSPEHRAAMREVVVLMGVVAVAVTVAAGGVLLVVAAALMALHVAPDAEGLSAAGVGALERLLAGVRVAVNPQRARPRERLVARLAHVPVLRLRECRRRRRRDVVVVLPRVRPRRGR